MILGLDALGEFGRVERRFVVVAQCQRSVLLFSRGGVLDAAGTLITAPDAPIAPGQKWTQIRWHPKPQERDWY